MALGWTVLIPLKDMERSFEEGARQIQDLH